MLIAAQRTGPVPVQVQRPQVHRADPQREPEHRPRARLRRRRGENRPPAGHRIGQVRLGHHRVLPVGIHARALAQRVLQLLDHLAHPVAGAQRPARYPTRHQHDAGTGHPGDPRAHPAQPGRGPPLSPADNSARIRPSLPPGISIVTTPGRHPADRTQPNDNRPSAASFARERKPSGRERAQRPPGPGPITDATARATPGASARHPDIAQTGMICARAADRDAYPTPIDIRRSVWVISALAVTLGQLG
jgi:hypothetical protein